MVISWLYVVIVVAVCCLYFLYRPLNRIKASPWQLSPQWVNGLRRKKRVGNVPPPFPNGWFAVLESKELKRRQIKNIDVLGQSLVVFRTISDEVFIVDSYCPHLGADLGQGCVINDTIECPFHEWKFRGADGKCVDIPYAKSVPEVAKIKSWSCYELNGFIYMWYHVEGDGPKWFPPEIPMVTDPSSAFVGRTEHTVLCHIQDIPENGADISHLTAIHSEFFLLPQIGQRLYHNWEASWTPCEAPERYCSQMTVTHSLVLFDKFRLMNMNITAKQIGPGIVHLRFMSPGCSGYLIQNVTPMGPLEQRIVQHFYVSSRSIVPYAKLILWGEALMLERDIDVWNKKIYISRPILVSEDRQISKHRKWYSQFYSPNSLSLEDVRQTLEW